VRVARLATALAVGLGLSPLPASAQEIVRFAASMPFTAANVELRGELFRPNAPGPFPAVVLMHGCGGWQPAVLFTLHLDAYYLRDHGFVVLNLDSFGPRGESGGALCADDAALLKALTYRTEDAFDALKFLRGEAFVDPANIFLMGQSNGGSVAINAALRSSVARYGASQAPFRGIVAFYPWCGIFGASDVALASPLLIFGGAKDDWVHPASCRSYHATGAALQVVIYPEAAHSFDLEIMPQRYLGKLIGGDEAAATDSRQRMLDFLVGGIIAHKDSPAGPTALK
jgi:dienelactone hydrolase